MAVHGERTVVVPPEAAAAWQRDRFFLRGGFFAIPARPPRRRPPRLVSPVEIVSGPKPSNGFRVQPRRWVVEPTNGWINHCRPSGASMTKTLVHHPNFEGAA
jgi:hypothetical protein